MRLFEGDCLSVLKGLPDDSVDSIVTDPPYGLSFMSAKWDYDVPSVEIWRECLRVLKPGGHLLAFAGSRTYHRLVVNVEDAGFEIRDQIMWVYGSGFPKSHNIGHKAEEWDGWGSALKPAHEPIVVARKPLIGTIVENVLEHGTGGLNIDGCRVKMTEDDKQKSVNNWKPKGYELKESVYEFGTKIVKTEQPKGRFPANFIHDGSDEVVSLFPESTGGHAPKKSKANPFGGVNETEREEIHYATGSAARFFYCAKASKSERNAGLEAFEDKKSQHNAGGIGRKVSVEKRLEQGKENAPMMKNIHPTVKPVDLMKYLCRLVTPPEGLVLDPFMGSGTTGIAAKVEGFDFIGIEMDGEYLEIAKSRIGHWVEEAEVTYKTLHDWL
tara:strand:+ start:1261 stop:2409 length:1149 start_codon:yes stop_codon:yes gene_type:complete